MLTVFDPADRENQFCDGLSRRNFLKIGALGAAGLTLPQLLASEAAAGINKSTKSVILIYERTTDARRDTSRYAHIADRLSPERRALLGTAP